MKDVPEAGEKNPQNFAMDCWDTTTYGILWVCWCFWYPQLRWLIFCWCTKGDETVVFGLGGWVGWLGWLGWVGLGWVGWLVGRVVS